MRTVPVTTACSVWFRFLPPPPLLPGVGSLLSPSGDEDGISDHESPLSPLSAASSLIGSAEDISNPEDEFSSPQGTDGETDYIEEDCPPVGPLHEPQAQALAIPAFKPNSSPSTSSSSSSSSSKRKNLVCRHKIPLAIIDQLPGCSDCELYREWFLTGPWVTNTWLHDFVRNTSPPTYSNLHVYMCVRTYTHVHLHVHVGTHTHTHTCV